MQLTVLLRGNPDAAVYVDRGLADALPDGVAHQAVGPGDRFSVFDTLGPASTALVVPERDKPVDV